jgi:RNA polymerase sigma-70 factor (ECF subfamily)
VQPPEQLAAYETLLRRYLAPLRRLAYAYTHDPGECQDLSQEIALALWTALPQFRGEASERTWLYRVAHNTAVRFTTRQSRRARHEQALEAIEDHPSEINPERSAIDAQRREQLFRAVHSLPLPDRQIVLLHLEGLSAADIQEITGRSAGSVATRLTRTRQKLANQVRKGVEP